MLDTQTIMKKNEWKKNLASAVAGGLSAEAGMLCGNEGKINEENVAFMVSVIAAMIIMQFMAVAANRFWSKNSMSYMLMDHDNNNILRPKSGRHETPKAAAITAFITAMGIATGFIAKAVGEHGADDSVIAGMSRLNPSENSHPAYLIMLALTAMLILLHAVRPILPSLSDISIPVPGFLHERCGATQFNPFCC